MNDYVLKMHLSSGLLDYVWVPSLRVGATWAERENEAAWRQLAIWIRSQSGQPKNTYLAGNSIHFDRSWLTEHRPDILELVSHRMFDVSSFLIARPDLRSGTPAAHRAMADAQFSLDTYRKEIYPMICRQSTDDNVFAAKAEGAQREYFDDLNDPGTDVDVNQSKTREHNISDRHGL